MSESFNVPLSQLVLSSLNARSFYDQQALERMAADMRRERDAGRRAVMNPLLVRARPLKDDDAVRASYEYEVICGSRRLQAAKLAELEHVPVMLEKLTDVEAIGRTVHENKDREDFHFLDLAESWRRWKEAGKSIEDIAVEMGAPGKPLGRSTVYATIELCKLTPEVKRACWDGRLTETSARDLLMVLPELQGKALKKMLEPKVNPLTGESEKKTTREMKEDVLAFRVDLTKVAFDPTDTALYLEAGACGPCPHRSGNRLELFGDTPNKDLCGNPPCATKKGDAHWARLVDDGEHNRGPKCIADKDAARLKLFDERGAVRDDAPYVDANAECHEDTAQRPYSALLGKSPRQHFELARVPKTGVIVELLDRKKLPELLDEAGKIRRRPTAAAKAGADDEPAEKLSAEDRAKLEEKRRLKQLARVRIVAAIADKVSKREPDKRFWRFIADCLFEQSSVGEEVTARRDIRETPDAYLDRLNEAQLRAFVFEACVSPNLYGIHGSDKFSERLKECAELFAVDVKEHESAVVAEERAKPKLTKAEDAAEKPAQDEKPAPKKTPKPKKAAKK